MLDIGWTELLVIAIVLIVVVGPHDLPKVMKAIAELYGKARRMAARFRADMDALAREVELEELRRKVKLYEFQNPRQEVTRLLGVEGEERIVLDDDLPGAPVPAPSAPAGLQEDTEQDDSVSDGDPPDGAAAPSAREKRQASEQDADAPLSSMPENDAKEGPVQS
ncbi:MAG: twin-arginine translocase subunit TatB [Alphaproteobacteria bacterium]|nr:MAG: twin-arginine translocase subunit TatB [Alphaproteobacteria bacterium]